MRVKHQLLAAALLLTGCLWGCQDTLIYGESTAFNLAIHVNDNPQTPIETNIGLKRYVGEMAPPVATKDEKGKSKAAGEAVSSFSGFALTYEKHPTFVLLGNLHIRTQFATGHAAKNLAEDPQQAAQVIKADFQRSVDFGTGAKQDRVQRIVDAITALDDPSAAALACSPPIHDSKLSTLAEESDPGCVDRKEAGFAREFLTQAAIMDDRTDEGFAGWESALHIQ